MNVDDLTVGQAREIAVMFAHVPAPLEEYTTEHGLQIVVLDRGFVYVGEVTTDAHWVVIRNARCVRVWGTTEGLGQLAEDGPTERTILDRAGQVRAPIGALISLTACRRGAWTS